MGHIFKPGFEMHMIMQKTIEPVNQQWGTIRIQIVPCANEINKSQLDPISYLESP